jgi:hypothetical protein
MVTQCVPCKQNTFPPKGPSKVEGILVFLMSDGNLSFWSVPILRPLAKQSIELSNDISEIPCNMLDILTGNIYTSTILFLAQI